MTEHKGHQQDYFDHEIEDPEFEITRPRGAGRFYAFLMQYKIGAAVRLVGADLKGLRVLVVCAGSGMDAELLLQYGPQVTCLDISTGALSRAGQRARRYGIQYDRVAADVERLPFADRAFDYAFVHDGLHHLTDPNTAISEMARISRRGVIITEPADALLSRLAIRLGLMPALEEAGNRVVRFHPSRLRPLFHHLGLSDVRHHRYLVKYPHQPSYLFRLLDLPGIYYFARLAFLVLGAHLFGAAGNKLAVVALAEDSRRGSTG